MSGIPPLDSKFRWFRINLLGPGRKKRDYYFRGLTRKEVRAMAVKPIQTEAEDYILRHCVWEGGPEMLAGSSNVVLENVYNATGLTEHLTPLVNAKEWLKHQDGCYEAAALLCVPGLTAYELDNCDPIYYYRYIICGSLLFEKMFGVTPEKAFTDKGETKLIQGDGFPGMKPTSFSWKKGK